MKQGLACVQIIFTGIPVWSALLAYCTLGEHPLHSMGYLGAVLIVAAGFTIASEKKPKA